MGDMTDLERLLKLSQLIADDAFAGGCKTVNEYRQALLCSVVRSLGYTPDFITERQARLQRNSNQVRTRRDHDDAYRGPRR